MLYRVLFVHALYCILMLLSFMTTRTLSLICCIKTHTRHTSQLLYNDVHLYAIFLLTTYGAVYDASDDIDMCCTLLLILIPLFVMACVLSRHK